MTPFVWAHSPARTSSPTVIQTVVLAMVESYSIPSSLSSLQPTCLPAEPSRWVTICKVRRSNAVQMRYSILLKGGSDQRLVGHSCNSRQCFISLAGWNAVLLWRQTGQTVSYLPRIDYLSQSLNANLGCSPAIITIQYNHTQAIGIRKHVPMIFMSCLASLGWVPNFFA